MICREIPQRHRDYLGRICVSPAARGLAGEWKAPGDLDKPSGKRVISKTALDALFKPTKTNPSYGHLWWLNGAAYALAPGANATRTTGQLIPAAPTDLVAAQGAQDRKLYVVPSRQLIVVRTGQATPDRDFNQQLWLRLMKAAPKQTN